MKRVVVLILGVLLLFCQSAAAQSVDCPPVVGIKKVKQYLKRGKLTCAQNARTLEKKGFVPFVVPTTVTPTPTVAPTPGPDFTGNYSSGSSPLLIVEADDTCDELGFNDVPSVDVDVFVTHDATDSRVTGEDDDGRRSWGVSSTTSFNLVDTADVIECSNGLRTSETTFSSITDTSASVVRVDTFNCRLINETCTRRWIGTAAR